MALITYLIVPLIILLVLFLVFKFIFGKIFKYFFIACILIIVTTTVLGYFIYKDAVDLADKFPKENKLVLIVTDKVESGFTFSTQDPVFLTQDQINLYNQYYLNKDYGSILENNYKLLILNIDKIEFTDQVLDYEGFKLDKVLILEVIKSDNPKDLFYNLKFSGVMTKEQFDSSFNADDVELKSGLGLLLFMQEFRKNGVVFIIKEFKKGNIIIYPETMVFKFIKILPSGFVNDIAGNLGNQQLN